MVNSVPNHEKEEVTFEEFREEWLRDFAEGELSTLAKGRKFAQKLVTQWLDINDDDENLEPCDGGGDGGIDIAYLQLAEPSDGEQASTSVEGDTWYVVQSKYGKAFKGRETVVSDGQKVIATLAGNNPQISEKVRQLVTRIDSFRQKASDRDRIILVFATDRPMNESDRQALRDVGVLGREHFPGLFEVEDISLQTIWEARVSSPPTTISLPIQGNFVDPSAGLRVGTISLTNLYEFLKGYRDKTGNLDQLYEKNVRQFLGSRRKVNKGIDQTLRNSPELFGLYNNGITIVVSDFSVRSDGCCTLFDPYVVNGCQTTKTIWEVMRQKLDTGGTGESATLEEWKARADRGVVVAKVVKGSSAQITEITRYTNSQTAVRDQDFITLRSDFKTWADAMASQHGVFLEIQRGGWDSQKAYQSSHPNSHQFKEHANAYELIKVYGAGWLREPGSAFGRKNAFIPGGAIFNRITTGEEPFGVNDLYAAYHLQKLAEKFKFGRSAEKPSRRQTRYLFYFVAIDLLRDTFIRANLPYSGTDLTNALMVLSQEGNQEVLHGLADAAIEVVDEYLLQESGDSVFKEPTYEGNLNTYLKGPRLGKDEEFSPLFKGLLSTHKVVFGRSTGGATSPRELIARAISSASTNGGDEQHD